MKGQRGNRFDHAGQPGFEGRAAGRQGAGGPTGGTRASGQQAPAARYGYSAQGAHRAAPQGARGKAAPGATGAHGMAMPDQTAYMPAMPGAGSGGKGAGGGKSSHASTKMPHKAVFIALGIFIAILAIAYGAGVFVFHERFYPQTSLGSLDISMNTREEAAEQLTAVESNYEVAVSGEGLDFVVSAEDGGVSIDADAVISSAASDVNPWLWFIQMWGTHDETSHLAASSDEGALADFVRAQVDEFNADAEPSEDASIVYSSNSGAYEIKQEVYGTQVAADQVASAVATAIATMQDTVQVTEDMLVKPQVLSDDERLASGRDAANAMIKCDVTLKSSDTGVQAGEVNGDVISQWISFGEDFQPTLDEEAMGAWIDDLSSAYNTIGTTRTYTRGDGKEVTAEGGDYGWSVDSETLKSAVKDAIDNGTQGDLEVSFTSTGNGYTKAGMDWGAYCDVDLTEQHAYYYDASGDLLWESGIVSGVPDAENSTPTGIYWLKNLQQDVSLKGPIDPKTNKPEWDSPVDYWMPFVDNLVGLHDASWQPSWVFSDASAYKTYGSHGCVNLPTKKAAQLFDIIQIGDPVIVHW